MNNKLLHLIVTRVIVTINKFDNEIADGLGIQIMGRLS